MAQQTFYLCRLEATRHVDARGTALFIIIITSMVFLMNKLTIHYEIPISIHFGLLATMVRDSHAIWNVQG